MFDLDRYLAKLGCTGVSAPDLATLRTLHKRHLMTVPFDNYLNEARGLGIWKNIDIDLDEIFDAVVMGGRGGVCYELNGLFRELLRRLGYDVVMMSAGVRAADGTFGPDLEHLFTVGYLDGSAWLIDVGYSGPSFIEPVRVSSQPQEQYGCHYRVTDQYPYCVLERRAREGSWLPVYRFREKARDVSEWSVPNEHLAAYARQIAENVLHIRGRATSDGQLTLVGRRYLTVADGHEKVKVLVKPEEFDSVLNDILRRS